MAAKKKIEIKSPSNFAKGIKNKWLVWGLGSVGVVFVLIVMSGSGNEKKSRRIPTAPEFVDATPTNPNESVLLSRIQTQLAAMNEQISKERKEAQLRETALKKEIENLKEEQEKSINKALEENMKSFDKRLEQLATEKASAKKDSAKEADKKPLDGGIYIPTSDDKGAKTPPPPPIYIADKDRDKKPASTPRSNLPRSSVQGGRVSSEPMIITGSTTNDNVISGSSLSKTETRKRKPGTYLPAGSFVRGTLITGADFGAGKKTQSNPQPVLIRLQADATLPGKAAYKLKDCFAIASGYGELSSERAYIQASRLSCVQEGTGKVLEAPILGFLADSDGKLGMRGELQRRSGMLLGKALLAGFADGASKIMTTTAQNAQQTVTGSGVVTSIDPKNIGEAAGWGGLSSAMEKLADQYIKEADSIFPVIEVESGRNITIIFQSGQELKWIEPMEEGDENV